MILFMKIKSFDFVKIIAPDKPASSACSCFSSTHYYILRNDDAGQPDERPCFAPGREKCFCRGSIKRIRITPWDFHKKNIDANGWLNVASLLSPTGITITIVVTSWKGSAEGDRKDPRGPDRTDYRTTTNDTTDMMDQRNDLRRRSLLRPSWGNSSWRKAER